MGIATKATINYNQTDLLPQYYYNPRQKKKCYTIESRQLHDVVLNAIQYQIYDSKIDVFFLLKESRNFSHKLNVHTYNDVKTETLVICTRQFIA